jgi:hypothetical protein
MVGRMAQVISLQDHRDRRNPLARALSRLEESVGRLDPLVRRSRNRLHEAVQRELLAIAAEVSRGRPLDAAARADRLADRLEHPAALG